MCSARDVSIQSLQCSSGQQRTDAQSPSGDINTSFPSMLLCAMRAQPNALRANTARLRGTLLASANPLFPPCFVLNTCPTNCFSGQQRTVAQRPSGNGSSSRPSSASNVKSAGHADGAASNVRSAGHADGAGGGSGATPKGGGTPNSSGSAHTAQKRRLTEDAEDGVGQVSCALLRMVGLLGCAFRNGFQILVGQVRCAFRISGSDEVCILKNGGSGEVHFQDRWVG